MADIEVNRGINFDIIEKMRNAQNDYEASFYEWINIQTGCDGKTIRDGLKKIGLDDKQMEQTILFFRDLAPTPVDKSTSV